MTADRSKFRRSAERAGPVAIALLLGAVLVASSALSYRDAKTAAFVVGERQGINFLHRLERSLLRRQTIYPAELRAALEANRALGMTYIAIQDHDRISLQDGVPSLGHIPAAVGAPAFGPGRVRMVGPGGPAAHNRGERGPPHGPPPFADDPHGGPPPEERPPPSMAPPALPPPPPLSRRLIIEFEPIGSEDVLRRALTVLILSSGAAILLTVAAFILWAGARRADQAELRITSQRHLAQLGEMSAVLAHEIRNPLSSLKGHAQLLAEKIDDPALAARVNRVVSEAVRLEHLTNDLLDFARTGTIERAPADPSAILRQAAAATTPDRIELRTLDAPAEWALDAARMEQVLINLLDNALAVTPPDLKVEASVERTSDALTYTVRDRGLGVPPDERTRIFEPFHTTKIRGTGLGLSVARRIVEWHGGRIDVGDADDGRGGAQFRVYIPEGTRPKP